MDISSEASVQKFKYKVGYDEYQIDLGKVYYTKLVTAVKKFSRNPKGRILDIGCWDGTFVAQFMGERECYGIEGNLAACQRAVDKGVRAQAADMEKRLPFDDGHFDVITAAEVIEHVYDTDFFLQEIRRMLAADGVLVMSIPNVACMTNRLTMLFGKYPRYAEYRAGGAGHIRVYTADVIKKQLQENGFRVVHYVGCNLPLPMHSRFIPSAVKKLAARLGDHFPTIAGQTILAAVKA